jgi:hypothetical protein
MKNSNPAFLKALVAIAILAILVVIVLFTVEPVRRIAQEGIAVVFRFPGPLSETPKDDLGAPLTPEPGEDTDKKETLPPTEDIVDIAEGALMAGSRTADFNGDGIVNGLDADFMFDNWGYCSSEDCLADLNGDGIVNIIDLLLLLSSWGQIDGEEQVEEPPTGGETSSFGLALQGEFATPEQQDLMANSCLSFDRISVNSSVIKCLSTDTIQNFIDYTDEEIENSITNFANNRDINTLETTDYFLLNCESPVHPGNWGDNESWGNSDEINEELRTEYFLALKRRVDIFRQLMPNAIFSLGPTIRSHWEGRYFEPIFNRIEGAQRAGELGVFDNTSCFEPRVFHSQGPDDPANETWMEDMTRQALDVASTELTNSTGAHLPLCVTSSILVFNGSSANNREPVSSELAQEQVEIVAEYDSVLMMNWWSGNFEDNIHPNLFADMNLCTLTE